MHTPCDGSEFGAVCGASLEDCAVGSKWCGEAVVMENGCEKETAVAQL